MARVVLVVLACYAVRADEYGGAGMPQYGDMAEDEAAAPLSSSALDYRGHSPDAPAPLDYKYEEEPQGNTEKSTKDTIESDSWKRLARKQRGLKRDRDEPFDGGADVAGVEPFPKKAIRRRSRQGARLAGDEPRSGAGGEGEPVRRRRGRRGRSRQYDDPQPRGYLGKGDYRVAMNNNLDEDVDTFTARETNERIKRRKPRDRLLNNYVKPLKIDDLDSDDELITDRKQKTSSSMEREEEGRVGGGGARFDEREWYRPTLAPPPPAPLPELPEDENEDDDVVERPRGRHKSNEYHDYRDYYDMRRVHNIKSQLPMLIRRTTTRSPLPGGEPSADATLMDLMALLSTARRALPAAAAVATFGIASAATHPPRDLDDPSESTTTTPTTEKTTAMPVRTSSASTTELSIAEKSRLSILKKSQKKENDKGEPSKKPPVLLQVTSKMPTIVMVEPPTSADPWMRARHVSNNSPQQLEKVKRLMRHKLVAGAKSIQDLTDNWDDMVCDYIDVSLLDSAVAHKMSRHLCVTFAFVFVIIR